MAAAAAQFILQKMPCWQQQYQQQRHERQLLFNGTFDKIRYDGVVIVTTETMKECDYVKRIIIISLPVSDILRHPFLCLLTTLFRMMKEQEEKDEAAVSLSSSRMRRLEPHFPRSRLLSSLDKAETKTTTSATTGTSSLRRQLQDFNIVNDDDDAGDDVSYLGEDGEDDPACDGMSTPPLKKMTASLFCLFLHD
jgi:hypothetical protein